MTQIIPNDTQHIQPAALPNGLLPLDKHLIVTSGSYEMYAEGLVCDLDWNHMDHYHRPFIHNTYTNSVRISSGKDFQLSITKLGKLPLFSTITDVRLGSGLFYQVHSIFNILTIISTIQMEQNGKFVNQRIDWHIASSRWVRFLHPLLHKKLYKLNKVQNDEDIPIRAQRKMLRKKGFTFKSDSPNFLNSNTPLSETNVIPPCIDTETRLSLGDINSKQIKTHTLGYIDLLIRADDKNGYFIWPSVCPHEGGPLIGENARAKDQLECPWHGLKVTALHLTPESVEGSIMNLKIILDKNEIIVIQRSSEQQP